MIIDKYKLFEKLSKAKSEEELKSLLESDQLNEGLFDSIKNIWNKIFGGGFKELDKLLSKYKVIVEEYWVEWTKITLEINKEQVLQNTSVYNSVERKKHELREERLDKQLKQLEESRNIQEESIGKQAKSIINGSEKSQAYWDAKSAILEEEMAKLAYENAKKASNVKTLDSVYKEIEDLASIAKEKDNAFKKEYGSYESPDYDPETFIQQDLARFQTSVLKLDAEEIKIISKYLNDELKKEVVSKKSISDELKKSVDALDKTDKDLEVKKKEIEDKFNPKIKESDDTIDDIEDKIDVLRKRLAKIEFSSARKPLDNAKKNKFR